MNLGDGRAWLPGHPAVSVGRGGGGAGVPGLPPLRRQPDLHQEEQQHLHPLRRDGHVADEGGHGQLSLVII